MMLPGVELARKRRIHHRAGAGVGVHDAAVASRLSTDISPWWMTSMGESAALARKRLDEKLHGTSSAASTTGFFRHLRHDPQGETAGRIHARDGEESVAGRRKGGKDERPQAPRVAAGEREVVCAVCLDELRPRRCLTRLPCSHEYHSGCVMPWLVARPECPSCRKLVVTS